VINAQQRNDQAMGGETAPVLTTAPCNTIARPRPGARPSQTNLGEIARAGGHARTGACRPASTGAFLFEDNTARTGFLLPDNCRKVSTRARCFWMIRKAGSTPRL